MIFHTPSWRSTNVANAALIQFVRVSVLSNLMWEIMNKRKENYILPPCISYLCSWLAVYIPFCSYGMPELVWNVYSKNNNCPVHKRHEKKNSAGTLHSFYFIDYQYCSIKEMVSLTTNVFRYTWTMSYMLFLWPVLIKIFISIMIMLKSLCPPMDSVMTCIKIVCPPICHMVLNRIQISQVNLQ